jgi:hypothetical protein
MSMRFRKITWMLVLCGWLIVFKFFNPSESDAGIVLVFLLAFLLLGALIVLGVLVLIPIYFPKNSQGKRMSMTKRTTEFRIASLSETPMVSRFRSRATVRRISCLIPLRSQ